MLSPLHNSLPHTSYRNLKIFEIEDKEGGILFLNKENSWNISSVLTGRKRGAWLKHTQYAENQA